MFIQENAIENVVCEMASISSQPQRAKFYFVFSSQIDFQLISEFYTSIPHRHASTSFLSAIEIRSSSNIN